MVLIIYVYLYIIIIGKMYDDYDNGMYIFINITINI